MIPESHDMKQVFSKLLGHGSKSVVGLDIGSCSIKLAQIVSGETGPVLQHAGIVDLPFTSINDERASSDISPYLRQLLAVSGVSSGEAVVAVSGQEVYLREAVFPQMPAAELREAIKWELEKYMAQAAATYYFDFAVLGPAADDLQINVLVVAARREQVDSLVRLVKSVGLRPAAVEIEPLAWQRAFNSTDDALIIDIGAGITQFTLFQAGCPVVMRTIDGGSHQLTGVIMDTLHLNVNDAERLKRHEADIVSAEAGEYFAIRQALLLFVGDLAREVQLTIDFYQRQHPTTAISKVLLTGGGAKFADLPQLLAQQLKLPVLTPDPWAKVTVSNTLEPRYTQAIAAQMAVAVGLALRGGGI